ncbi:hypothetical protein [Planococcus beigongshangi]|nr:hypothetical protein [Planococcus beigongshangi]
MEFELTNKEKKLIVEAIQGHLNNPKADISYEKLRDMSDLKERIRASINE